MQPNTQTDIQNTIELCDPPDLGLPPLPDLSQNGWSNPTPTIAADSEPASITARSLFDLKRPEDDDPSELLRPRYLSRGGGMTINGTTGLGKSTLAMQFMILWGIGKPCFGIEPVRPLKSLSIQAENDDGDLAEFRDGICAGLKLTSEEMKLARENVLVIRVDDLSGGEFFIKAVAPLLKIHKPDQLWIDPALAYLDGDTNSQKDVGIFLRKHLNPLLRKHDCGCVIVHHTNKPSGRKAKSTATTDFSYVGSGSAEWANWARASLFLQRKDHNTCVLQAGKRGNRLRWRDAYGEKSYCKLLAQSKEDGLIYWREMCPDEVDQGGRPEEHDTEEIISLLPTDGLATREWLECAKIKLQISESTFHRKRRDLQDGGRIQKENGKWKPTP
jgi:hypothetical protein